MYIFRLVEVLSGVQKASVFVPLAIVIFIIDLDQCTHLMAIMNKFADDTKVGHSVSVMGDKQFFELTVLAVSVLTKCTTQDTYLLTYKAYKPKLF